MEAMQLYDDGDSESSLMIYTFLAELGMEVAQSNAAFLLEQGFLLQLECTN
jgi:SEL1 protein